MPPCGFRSRRAHYRFCLEPLLFSHFTARVSGERLLQIVFGYIEEARRSETILARTNCDGIVCLPAIRSELPAADRVRKLLSAAFGSDWSAARERELLAGAAGEGNKPIESLDAWLREKFFEEHCKLFHHRPFVWHIWDGNRDGFHCLVNAHRLTGPDGEGRRPITGRCAQICGGVAAGAEASND